MNGDDLARLGEIMATGSPAVRALKGQLAVDFAERVKRAAFGVSYDEASAALSAMCLDRRTGDRMPQPADFVDRLAELSRRSMAKPVAQSSSIFSANQWPYETRAELAAASPSATVALGPIGGLKALMIAAGWSEPDVATVLRSIAESVPVKDNPGWRSMRCELLKQAVYDAVRRAGGNPTEVLAAWRRDGA